MGELKKKWETAKKASEKDFATAYMAWITKLTAEAKEGDAEAKKKIILLRLDESGMGMGSKFEKYCSFNEGLSPALDKLQDLEKAKKPVADAKKKVETILVSYNRQVTAYKKRWEGAGIEPDFWSDLLTALNKIAEEIKKIK